MWKKLSLPWQAAIRGAWEAYCAGSYPIGAAIASADGLVLVTGRNRLAEPHFAAREYLAGSRLAHAEINALLALDGSVVETRELVLYTTTEPCPMCAGAIVMADLRHVRFAARDPWAGSTELYQISNYMHSKRMHVEGPLDRPNGHTLETLLFGLQAEFFLRRSKKIGKADAVLASMQMMNPAGIALGRAIYTRRTLTRMASDGRAAEAMLDHLADIAQEVEALTPVNFENW